jgi:predicted GTPase
MVDESGVTSSIHSTDAHDDLNEVRIILLGKTGAGKSSLGNLLCGGQVFKTGYGGSSVTKECLLKQREVGRKLVKVIDTPGFFDTLTRQEDNHATISQSMQSSHPGPHAFLVVFQPGRLTSEERACIQKIKDVFGPTALNYCIFILTHGDELARQKMTFEDYLNTDPFLKNDLLPLFKQRHKVIDNTIPLTDSRNQKVVNELLRMISDLVAINNGTCLQNGLMQKISEIIREKQEAMVKFNLAESDGSIAVLPEIIDEVTNYDFEQDQLNTKPPPHTNATTDVIPDIVDEVITYPYTEECLTRSELEAGSTDDSSLPAHVLPASQHQAE